MDYCENFKWLNEGEIKIEEDKIVMKAPPLTDFFCGGTTDSEEGVLPKSLCNAPYYYTEIEGDFVLQVKVSHDFKDTYDSASVMVMQLSVLLRKMNSRMMRMGAILMGKIRSG